VSLISGFEKQCADAGMAVFLADASVEGPAESRSRFVFTKKFVGITSDAKFMTMDDWVIESLPENTSDLLLQIDIEGYEYEIFLGMSDALLRRFRIIVAEFHWLHQLWNGPWFEITSRAFEKVLQTHACVHIHPNNCCGAVKLRDIEIPRVAEFTFLRRDRILRSSPAENFPHPLDRDNTTKAPLPLPARWVNAKPLASEAQQVSAGSSR
jgi:Methyltransferase FkbM domain